MRLTRVLLCAICAIPVADVEHNPKCPGSYQFGDILRSAINNHQLKTRARENREEPDEDCNRQDGEAALEGRVSESSDVAVDDMQGNPPAIGEVPLIPTCSPHVTLCNSFHTVQPSV